MRTHSRSASRFQGALGALALSSLILCSGCASGLQLRTVKATQQKPSNVALYFKVKASSDEPVGGLSAEQFRIYEDGSLVSPFESKQVILNPEVAAAHYTMLLVDMSGSVSESGAAATVVDATTTFVERVEKAQKVGVYAFDGSPQLHPIAPFQAGGGGKGSVQSLGTFKPQDPSTNLNGAVVKGLQELDAALARDPAPLKFGTLVVFTDGTDRAARVTREEMRKAVKQTQSDVFAIGLGAEIKESTLGEIGKNGTALAANREAVVKAFDTIGARVEAETKSYYLLSYCSPARAGKHKVKVEAVWKAEGKPERTGYTEADFDASGFGPGCDPKTPPSFDVTKGDALAPKEEQKKDDEKDAKDKDKDKDKKPKPAAPAAKPKSGPPALPPPPPPEKKEAPAPAAKEEFKP